MWLWQTTGHCIPVTAIGDRLKRMILVGDSLQLPPLIFTKGARKIWAVSFLAELIARGHVTTRLNTEYPCHSIRYPPTSLLFYEGTVRSFNDTTLQPHPLNLLMQSLSGPILHDDLSVFWISGYTHFLNMAGSGYMLREVAARTF